MACRKCGSDWLTLRGRDCSSCPYCSKVQRSVERKRGRWIDKECAVPCKHCGETFAAKVFVGAQAKQAYCSKDCRLMAKAEWRKKWVPGYRSGARKQKQDHKAKQRPICRECGKQFNKQAGSNSSNIYCSKACFFAARSSGRQSWDKTNIKKAAWHHGGWYASAPSVQLMRRIAKAHARIARVGGSLERLAQKELNRPTCEHCGTPCNDGASRFCSRSCQKQWRGLRLCRCGKAVQNAGATGVCRCTQCRRAAAAESRKRIKKETGTHRKKCRKGGGFFNPLVRRKTIYARDRYRCYLCGIRCVASKHWNDPRFPTVDMVRPASKGGDYDYHNLRCACRQCNSLKSGKLVGQLTLSLHAR